MQRSIWLLAVLTSFCLSPQALSAQDAIGIEFVPPQAAAALVIRPDAIYNTPLLQMVPWEVASVKSQELTGVKIQDVDSILLYATPPGVDGRPTMGAVVRFAQKVELESLFPYWVEAGQLAQNVRPDTNTRYLQGKESFPLDVVPVDEKTYLMGMPYAIEAMLKQHAEPAESQLGNRVRQDLQPAEAQMFLLVEPIREMSQFILADPNLAAFPGLKDLPQQLSHAQLIGNLDLEKGGITLVLTARSEGEAEQLEQTMVGLLASSAKVARQMTQPKEPDSPEGKAIQQYTERISRTLESALKPTRTGKQVTLTTVGKPGTSPQVLLASGTAFFMPIVANARADAYRSRSANNLKQIMLAMHNFHDTFQHMPRDSYDADGKPLLSWRVHILPFIEQSALYNQFHLDEPWDSEHNRELIKILPATYTTPADQAMATEGRTRYLRPLGEGLPASEEGDLKFQDITDGTSNTLAVVEVPATNAVIWTRPGDFNVDMTFPVQSLLPGESKGVLGARYDGSVQNFLKESLSDDILKALLTHAGGEVVDFRD